MPGRQFIHNHHGKTSIAVRLALQAPEPQGDTCRVCRYGTTPGGYGVTRYEGRQQRTHRVVWQLAYGPIPKGMMVCHTCDNPPCCRLDHLFLGTAKDNARDMVQKGRGVYVPHPGERNGLSKLTDDDVRYIRLHRGIVRQIDLAHAFNTNQARISSVQLRKSWRHLI